MVLLRLPAPPRLSDKARVNLDMSYHEMLTVVGQCQGLACPQTHIRNRREGSHFYNVAVIQ